MPGRMKRVASPASWPLPRKVSFWATKPSPGPHSVESSVALLSVVRDMLHLTDNAKEASSLIKSGKVMVDGRVRKGYDYPVGIMDAVSIPEADEHYRMIVDRRGRLHLSRITGEEAGWKICRIEGIQIARGGKRTFSFHDGRTLMADVAARTGDTVRLALPEQKVLEIFRLEEGTKAFIAGGSHVGEIAEISKYEKWRNPAPNLIYFKEGFSTVWNNVFAAGRERTYIGAVEVSAI